MIQRRSCPPDESTKGGKALPSKFVNILIPNVFSKYKLAILKQGAAAFALHSIKAPFTQCMRSSDVASFESSSGRKNIIFLN